MSYRSLSSILCFSLLVAVLATGCGNRQPQPAAPQPPAVPISKSVQREVTDFVDFTGRTDAVQSVDVRARVTGYLTQMPFKEGAEVKQGEKKAAPKAGKRAARRG